MLLLESAVLVMCPCCEAGTWQGTHAPVQLVLLPSHDYNEIR
jgi:hypothetical protein